MYTITATLAVVLVAAFDLFLARTRLLLRKAFWTAYAIVLIFQLIVNGLLTGLPIVRYDPSRIAGLHVVYAPVEDLLFGFAMVTLTLTLWVWGGRAASSTNPAARSGRPGRGDPARRPPGG
jgi:lycopene cyclase domain-containing protein